MREVASAAQTTSVRNGQARRFLRACSTRWSNRDFVKRLGQKANRSGVHRLLPHPTPGLELGPS
jgi:hypothetical protein